MADKKSASKGLFAGIEETGKSIKEFKSENSKEFKNVNSKKETIKRSYSLDPSTLKKLQELKVFVYPNPSITYNEIVDEAINLLYDTKKK